MKKWMGAIALMGACSAASGTEDYRFTVPLNDGEKRQVYPVEQMLKQVRVRYDEARTFAKTDKSHWALDVKSQRLWLRFEKTI